MLLEDTTEEMHGRCTAWHKSGLQLLNLSITGFFYMGYIGFSFWSFVYGVMLIFPLRVHVYMKTFADISH